MMLSLLSSLAVVAIIASGEEQAQCPSPTLDAAMCARFIDPVRSELMNLVTNRDAECIGKLSKADAARAESAKRADENAKMLKAAQDEVLVLKKKVTEIEAHNRELKKELESVEVTKAKLKELEGTRAELESLKKTNAELGSLSKVNDGLTAELAAAKESHARATEEVKILRSKGTALASCEKSRSSSEQELASLRSAHARALSEKQQQLAALEAETNKLRTDFADSTEKIYTATQFWRSVDHSKHVGGAFILFARNKVVKLVGPDTYELVKLQMQLWYATGVKHVSSIYAPLKSRSVRIYNAHLKHYFLAALDRAAKYAEGPLQALQKRLNAALLGVENYMERVINNLADGTPTVRSVFPDNFHDRCFAFAFISLVLFLLSTSVQWAFTTFVSTPLSWVVRPTGTLDKSGESGGKMLSHSKSTEGGSKMSGGNKMSSHADGKRSGTNEKKTMSRVPQRLQKSAVDDI